MKPDHNREQRTDQMPPAADKAGGKPAPAFAELAQKERDLRAYAETVSTPRGLGKLFKTSTS